MYYRGSIAGKMGYAKKEGLSGCAPYSRAETLHSQLALRAHLSERKKAVNRLTARVRNPAVCGGLKPISIIFAKADDTFMNC
jgi:hypothetical protein